MKKITKLTVASMCAALALICFSLLRIEIPMGLGLTGKIYIGHAFIILAALLTGPKYGGLAGAVGLTLADILAGYVTSAPPTFVAKLLIGLTAGGIAYPLCHLDTAVHKERIVAAACIGASIVNIVTEPLLRFAFKFFVLGLPYQVASVSATNCAISMAASALPSAIVAYLVYQAIASSVLQHNLGLSK